MVGCAGSDDRVMDAVSISSEGRVRLDEYDLVRDWLSLAELASDYWRFHRLPCPEQDADHMAAWTCVHDLVGEPAWEGALTLLDAVLAQAADDDEIGLVAAGPLEELVCPAGQGPLFISGLEFRARGDRRWALAVSMVWLDEGADADVNRRLAAFGARHPDGRAPS
jgi:hypothetical protein